MLKIDCYGDSVTQGVTLCGDGGAEYGKGTYPSWLVTILTDRGYDVSVKNHGHAGERTADVCVRCGAMNCYTTEEIILPKHRGGASMGVRSFPPPKCKNIGTKLYIPKDEYGLSSDQYIYFNSTDRETNPATIGGVDCDIEVKSYYENEVSTICDYNVDTVIPAHSQFFVANKASADVNIFYAGFNDRGNLTLSDFINMNKACGAINGGNYIILGCTSPIWISHGWEDLTGTDEQRYAKYKKACYDAFENRFIDLYEEFSNRGIDIAVDMGLLSDKSEDELVNMRKQAKKHIFPAEFSNVGKSGNILHLSETGCAVIAVLVVERLEQLGYIG